MDNHLLSIAGVAIIALLGIIGYFLTNLHNRFEEHLRASAEADREFAIVKTKQEEMCERLDRVEEKVDKLSDKVDNLPYRVVELLKAAK